MANDGAPGRFNGRVAVVTGAASGIGAATARRLAREGAAVVLTDVDPTSSRWRPAIIAGRRLAPAVVADAADPAAWRAGRRPAPSGSDRSTCWSATPSRSTCSRPGA